MNKNFSIWLLALLLLLGGQGLAEATYYHFEDSEVDPVYKNNSTTWTYKLDGDNLFLWEIPEIPLQSSGANWDKEDSVDGSMNASDVLHFAYLTMDICNFDKDDVINIHLNGVLYDAWTKGNGGIQVYSYLEDIEPDPFGIGENHLLTVSITKVSGDFTVPWMKLTGCYAVVPEPGTLVLLGAGLVGLALLMRKKE